MPDYNFSDQIVAVKVYGKVLDENYSRVLFDHPEFDLETVFLIDKIQKRLPLEKSEIKRLRSLGIIEGKAPYVYVSAKVAEIIDEKAQYIKNRGQSDQYYRRLIMDYLHKWGEGTKEDFIKLLSDKLPDVLDPTQKDNKVRTLMSAMKKDEIIEPTTTNKRTTKWVLKKSD